MAEQAEEQTVAVLGPDKDFTGTLAEQLQGELDIHCSIFSNKNDFNHYVETSKKMPAAVVTSESAEESWPCPVITVQNPPVKLQDILDDMALILQNQKQEDIRLEKGYSLHWRQKQLSHAASGKSVGLTDKEARLLQQLAEAKGQVVAKEHLLKTIWGFDEALDTHTLETHIYRLRGKFRELAGNDTMIAAIEGGYRLEL